MRSRTFGRTGRKVSEIGFGAWAIGASWGRVDETDSLAALNAALDRGMTFIDTADVYGDGRSERLIARVLKERGGERPFVATKAGRRLPAQTVAGYTRENLNSWIDRSLENLEVDRLDLVQLHCPPTDLYYHAEVFGYLDDLVKAGKITQLRGQRRAGRGGAEGHRISWRRQRPDHLQHLPPAAGRCVLRPARRRERRDHRARAAGERAARGQVQAGHAIRGDDHRQFNRHGEAFDVGETFSGVPYDVGLAAVEKIRPLVGSGTMAQFALRWILMFDAVTVVIPGARKRRAGALERRSRRPSAAQARDHGGTEDDLRSRHQAPCPSALVTSPRFAGLSEFDRADDRARWSMSRDD